MCREQPTATSVVAVIRIRRFRFTVRPPSFDWRQRRLVFRRVELDFVTCIILKRSDLVIGPVIARAWEVYSASFDGLVHEGSAMVVIQTVGRAVGVIVLFKTTLSVVIHFLGLFVIGCEVSALDLAAVPRLVGYRLHEVVQ